MKNFERVLAFAWWGLLFIVPGCAPSSESSAGDAASPELSVLEEAESIAETQFAQSAQILRNADGSFKAFVIYGDANSPENHFDPSGWMGDYSDLKMSSEFMTNPHGGTTSIRVDYSAKKTQGAGWSGVYWQNPANNWGSKAGGYDLTGAANLSFWARGEKGGERIEEFKMGGITGEYPDSDQAGIGPVLLTLEWKQYSIDLSGKDLSSISGGFCWVANAETNPEGAVFYLDDIVYE